MKLIKCAMTLALATCLLLAGCGDKASTSEANTASVPDGSEPRQAETAPEAEQTGTEGRQDGALHIEIEGNSLYIDASFESFCEQLKALDADLYAYLGYNNSKPIDEYLAMEYDPEAYAPNVVLHMDDKYISFSMFYEEDSPMTTYRDAKISSFYWQADHDPEDQLHTVIHTSRGDLVMRGTTPDEAISMLGEPVDLDENSNGIILMRYESVTPLGESSLRLTFSYTEDNLLAIVWVSMPKG